MEPLSEHDAVSGRALSQIPDSDIDRLAAALATLLLSWWRRREQKQPR
jgi:hypothetical protein